jgi:hypothetical protein
VDLADCPKFKRQVARLVSVERPSRIWIGHRKVVACTNLVRDLPVSGIGWRVELSYCGGSVKVSRCGPPANVVANPAIPNTIRFENLATKVHVDFLKQAVHQGQGTMVGHPLKNQAGSDV